MEKISITSEPIELYKVLKLSGLAASGGEAKHLIAEGQVSLNGKTETQKRKKILAGDIIELDNNKISVHLE